MKRCIGEIGEAPPLTDQILKELWSPDPKNGGKKKKETHILALMPKTIKEISLSLNSLNDFKEFAYYSPDIQEEYGTDSYPETRWVLMTKELLEGSLGQTRDKQLEMASGYGDGYRAATLLEVALIGTLLFEKIRLFSDDRFWRYTCCLDKPVRGLKTVVGFAPASLYVNYDYDYDDVGVAALREF